jgi:hypothetical protein
VSDNTPVESHTAAVAAAVPSLRVFLSYRHAGAAADARLLYDHLARHLGDGNVFLNVINLQPGMNWLQAIDREGAGAGVLVALIDTTWTATTTDRTRAALLDPVPDIVTREIAFALRRGSTAHVLPVLIDDARMPEARELPRAIQALASIQAVPLRHAQFDRDLAHIIEVIEGLPGQPPAPVPAPIAPAFPLTAADVGVGVGANGPTPVLPPARHYQRVLRHLVDDGALVVALGSRVNASDGGATYTDDSPRLPDSSELAANLARQFGLDAGPEDDLAAIAQEVWVTSGKPDLYNTLRRLLAREVAPAAVHQVLARLPAELEHLGRTPRYPLIVTTNYDNALERAFGDANEPYDLAVYMASGPDRGRFVHFPYDGDPEAVTVANRYAKFPIDDEGTLTRTVIIKIHGGVDGVIGDYRWRENYVITEDQYIEYLSRSPIESVVPVQILDKLIGSHWLFLGYTMRDWNLRVFLNRIWRGEPIDARSWAIEPAPDEFEREFWSQAGVELVACPLVGYLAGLAEQLGTLRSSP